MAMNSDGKASSRPHLLRLSSPEEIPRPPVSNASKYSIDPYERLVRADFSGEGSMLMDPLDEDYLLELFERPDITVVIKGLAKRLDPNLWNTRYLLERCGTVMYHNFRRFCKADEDPGENFVAIPEVEKAWSSMKLSDYIRYLDKRADAAKRRVSTEASPSSSGAERPSASPPREAAGEEGSIDVEKGDSSLGNAGGGSSVRSERRDGAGVGKQEDSMVFTSFDGKPRTVKLLQESVYLTDMDLTRYLPECAVNLDRRFMMDILPGGASCATKYMPRESRPFLGPNLYITPPGSWTYFHQDGNGTVDSGHQCLTGRNRVIMLRRLNEADKRRAMRILAGDLSCGGDDGEGKGGGGGAEGGVGGEDPLYKMPHGPGRKPPWPSDEAVNLLRELNFCPSVFTLEPGEFVHINKGRLHAFRKEEPLPHEDPGSICVSVAWDWVYQGVTEAGCRRELGYALECAEDNRRAKSSSLAPVKTCLLQAAKSSLASLRVRSLGCEQPQLAGAAVNDVPPPPLPISSSVGEHHATPASTEIPCPSSNGSSGPVSMDSNGSLAKEAANGSSRHSTSSTSPTSTSSLLPTASALELFSRLRDLLPSEVMGAEEGLGPEGVMALRALGGVDVGEEVTAAMAMGSRGGSSSGSGGVGVGMGVNTGACGSAPVPADSSRTAARTVETEHPASSSSSSMLPPSPPLPTQPPTGLYSWITRNSRSTEASAGPVDPSSARSLAFEAAVAAAREVLENGARAAADAEASSTGANASSSVSCSSSAAASASAAGRSAMKAARLAVKAMLAASATKGTRGDDLGVGVMGVQGGGAGELKMVSALAPLLEKIVARQRSEWNMQAKTAAYLEKPPKLNPSRPGKRKLGPAAAKARDDAIVASMQRMEKPIRQAVNVVEIDSSVPMHLQKINPFSSDDGFSCSSCRCELFNAYMHCFGCEVLLSKDLNLCLGCHAQGRLAFPPLGKDELGLTNKCHCPSDPKATLLQREMKAVAYENTRRWPASRCGCGQESCSQCHLCVACACDCHHRFQLRFRFEHAEHLERLTLSVRAASGGVSTIPFHLSSLETSAKNSGSSSSSSSSNIGGGNADGDGLTQPRDRKRSKTNGCRVDNDDKPQQGSDGPCGTVVLAGGAAAGDDEKSAHDHGPSDGSAVGPAAAASASAMDGVEGSSVGGVDGCPVGDTRKRSDDERVVPSEGGEGGFDDVEGIDGGKRRRVEGSSKKNERDELGAPDRRTASSSSGSNSSGSGIGSGTGTGGDSCIIIE